MHEFVDDLTAHLENSRQQARKLLILMCLIRWLNIKITEWLIILYIISNKLENIKGKGSNSQEQEQF